MSISYCFSVLDVDVDGLISTEFVLCMMMMMIVMVSVGEDGGTINGVLRNRSPKIH